MFRERLSYTSTLITVWDHWASLKVKKVFQASYLCVSIAHTGVLAADRGALNLAIKDQLAALEWVQANIESFGGDKEKVIQQPYILLYRRTLMKSRLPYLGKVLGQS